MPARKYQSQPKCERMPGVSVTLAGVVLLTGLLTTFPQANAPAVEEHIVRLTVKSVTVTFRTQNSTNGFPGKEH
jgi:hypothetical protein